MRKRSCRARPYAIHMTPLTTLAALVVVNKGDGIYVWVGWRFGASELDVMV
jgi:hypothetical protein